MTTQRNDDSAMTNLRDLMLLEQERIEGERLARVQAEAERARRAAEERTRAEAEALERTRAAEQARIDAERTRREIEARMEAERSDRELRIRLEVEQKRRADEHAAMLAHQERLAQFAPPPRRSISGGAAVGLVGLTLGGIIAVGAILHTQLARPLPTPAVTSTPVASAPTSDIAELTRQRDLADQRARDAIAAADALRNNAQPAPRPVRPHNDGHPTVRPVRPATNNAPIDIDGDGDSMITSAGIEGGRPSTRRTPRR